MTLSSRLGPKLASALGALVLAGAAGCAAPLSEARPLTTPDREPVVVQPTPVTEVGRLRVWTARTLLGQDETRHCVHLPYEVRREGKLVRRVENHWSSTVQTPSVVPLAPGRYEVRARSSAGPVSVQVQIASDRLTEVHLEGLLERQDAAPTSAVSG